MRGFRTATGFMLIGGCLAVAIPGAAQGGPRATAKTIFQVTLPESGQIALAKLTLTVKAKPGKAVPKRISLKLGLQGTLASSAAVIAGPAQVVKISKGKAQVTAYVAIVNKRGVAAARIVAGRRAPRTGAATPFLFLAGPAAPAAVQAKTAAALTISAGLKVGSCPGCKPLTEAAKRTACANNLKQLGLALHAFNQPVLGAISPQSAWTSAWGIGCGAPQPSYLLPYTEITGKNPHCTAFVGFGNPPFQSDNILDLGCPIAVSSVTVLGPNNDWNTGYTRWSRWAVYKPGGVLDSTGSCVGDGWDQSPWGSSFRCDLPKPMPPNVGQHFVVAFGPVQPTGTNLVISVLDQNGLDFLQPNVVGQR